MRKLICGLVFVMAASAVNIAWAQTPEVVDPVRPVAVETYLCTLNTGKTMADVDAVNATWLAAVAEGPFNGLEVQLTPRYGKGPYDVIFFEYLALDQVAQYREWYDDNGQDVNAAFQEAVSCQTQLNGSYLTYVSEAILQDDDQGFVSLNWCTIRDGVSAEALAAERNTFAHRLNDANVRAAYSVMFPHFGVRTENRLGDFAQVMVYPDWTALASAHQHWATGGWRAQGEYQRKFAQCTGSNVYDAVILHRPHTPWFE